MKKTDIRIESEKEKLICRDGKAQLFYLIEIPHSEELKKFNRFYEKIRSECIEFCKQKLTQKCVGEQYYTYRLSCKPRVENDRLVLTFKATLSNKTSRRILLSNSEIHKWDARGVKLRIIK